VKRFQRPTYNGISGPYIVGAQEPLHVLYIELVKVFIQFMLVLCAHRLMSTLDRDVMIGNKIKYVCITYYKVHHNESLHMNRSAHWTIQFVNCCSSLI